MTETYRVRLLASSALTAACMAFVAPTQVDAQQATAATAAAASPTSVQEIVVTGSLFRRTDIETPSPVTVFSAPTS